MNICEKNGGLLSIFTLTYTDYLFLKYFGVIYTKTLIWHLVLLYNFILHQRHNTAQCRIQDLTLRWAEQKY